ncbi:MAG: BMP family ABC transporter substrate-binding protein [Gaiellaceae bacterium]|jgi:basic membrane protein A
MIRTTTVRWIGSVVFVVAAVALAVFAGQARSATAAKQASCPAGLNCKVALIISDAGLGDKGFNDLGYAGLKSAASQYGVTGSPVQDPQIDTHCTQDLTAAAQGGYGLIINLNYGCQTALEQVAQQFPNVMFVMVDNVATGANVASEMFDVQDSSFLAGVAAAMLNKDGNAPQARGKHVLGAIGGVKSPGIDQFLVGYQQGAQYIDKTERILIAYANSFADPSKGAALTNSMFSQGATVVYQVAGVTGLGGIKAAKQKNLFAIGVDSNQDYLAPGHVLTSSLKRTNTAVYTAVADYVQGKLKGNTTLTFGLANNGVGISPMRYTKKLLPAADLKRLALITRQIETGKIKVWNVPTQGYPSWFAGGK